MMARILVIMQGALLELKRRRDAAVVMFFGVMILMLVVVGRVMGINSQTQARFLLDLGLSLSVILAQIATLVVAGRMLPDEREHRTIYPLMARPVSRAEVVIGKWLAASLAGIMVFGVTSAVVLMLAPWGMIGFVPGLMLSWGLQLPALLCVAALALFLSLCLPLLPSVLVGGGLVFASPVLARWSIISPILNVLPQISRLNGISASVSGATISVMHAGVSLTYGLGWTGVLLGLAVWRFSRLKEVA